MKDVGKKWRLIGLDAYTVNVIETKDGTVRRGSLDMKYGAKWVQLEAFRRNIPVIAFSASAQGRK